MDITFTPDQQKVIELHDRDILVSAAAGSGKTAVLVERIVRMVCDEENPVDIDRLLIVTFTNAAAAEMRERISAGIAGRILMNPESEHLERQETLLHNALITTIDSFCLYLLRNHFHEIGLDPAFRVADEGEIKLLQQDVLDKLLEDRFTEKDPSFLDCVEFFSYGGRESVLENIILDFYTFAMSYPWPEKWLEERRKDYDIHSVEELQNSDMGHYVTAYLGKVLHGCLNLLEQIQKLCEEPDGPYMYAELIESETEAIQRLISCSSLTDMEATIFNIEFKRLPVKKDSTVSSEKREKAKVLRGIVKDTIKEVQSRFFARPLVGYVKQLRNCAPYVEVLIDLTLDFYRRLAAAKQDKKIVDFNDMEHFALNILLHRDGDKIVPSPVALEYRTHFSEILIDEYQDSNLVQEYLLKAVSGEDDGIFNRFMVGDIKQSIYKFRLARPELFLEKYEAYSVEESMHQRIDLSKNFRSREEVIETVNHIFKRIMSKDKGSIVYDEKAALYPGAAYPENYLSGREQLSEAKSACKSELILIEKPQKGEEWNAKQAEGHAIAARIKELKANFRVTDKKTGNLRPVRYSDMVILLRSNSGWDEELKGALWEEGIPVYITTKTGYFDAKEVQVLLQFLRVLDNPCRDIPLFGVMKSVFGGFTEEEIAILRGSNRKCSLWEAVKNSAEEKVHAFYKMIERYRSYSIYMPIRELLQRIVEDFSYLHYVSAMPAGNKRKANVEMLFTKASDFEKTSYFGLFHFVRYIEQLEKYDVDFGEAELMDENADLVRIMSIHKSKGLEFPVTFVAGMAKRFNMQDISKPFLMDMDMGIATDYVNSKARTRNVTFRKAVLSQKMKEDDLAEELRILYVALTRAREKLIMTATIPNAAKRLEEELGTSPMGLTFMQYINSGSYLDLVLPVINLEVADVSVCDQKNQYSEIMMQQMDLSMKQEQLVQAGEYADPDILQILEERFAYQYRYENLSSLYTKTTVSELKIAAMADKDEAAYHTFEEKEVIPYLPGFCREKEQISATARGNAYHKIMELLDFERVYQGVFTDGDTEKSPKQMLSGLKQDCLEKNLKSFLDEQVIAGSLSAEYRAVLNERKCVRFLANPIAVRMWYAQRQGRLYKEQPFVYGISANRINAEFPENEKVLIQGIIDAFFIEEDGIVLLDYKTDRVSSEKELWARYETQLDHYEEALCRLMDLPVKERILYSFSLEKCVSKE